MIWQDGFNTWPVTLRSVCEPGQHCSSLVVSFQTTCAGFTISCCIFMNDHPFSFTSRFNVLPLQLGMLCVLCTVFCPQWNTLQFPDKWISSDTCDTYLDKTERWTSCYKNNVLIKCNGISSCVIQLCLVSLFTVFPLAAQSSSNGDICATNTVQQILECTEVNLVCFLPIYICL